MLFWNYTLEYSHATLRSFDRQEDLDTGCKKVCTKTFNIENTSCLFNSNILMKVVRLRERKTTFQRIYALRILARRLQIAQA